MAKGNRESVAGVAAAAAAAAVDAVRSGDQVIVEAASDEEAEVMADALAGLRRLDVGEPVTWEIHCVEHKRHEPGFIGRLTVDELDPATIKRKFGPGKYRILGRARGAYVRGSHVTITISDFGEATAPSAAPAATDATAVLQRFLESQATREREQAAARRELLTALAAPAATLAAAIINRPRPPAIDPALIAALTGKQSSIGELTTALANLEQLRSKDGGADKLDMALKLIDKLKDLPAGEDSTGSGWADVLRDLLRDGLPAAAEFLKQRQEQARAPQAARVPYAPAASPRAFIPPRANGANGAVAQPPPAPAADPQAPVPPVPAAAIPTLPVAGSDDPMLKMVEPWLRKQAEQVTEWASNNIDAELAAEMLLANVPALYRKAVDAKQLIEWASRPDWWQMLVMFHPPLAAYQAWVSDLRDELLAMLEEELREEGGARADQSSDARVN